MVAGTSSSRYCNNWNSWLLPTGISCQLYRKSTSSLQMHTSRFNTNPTITTLGSSVMQRMKSLSLNNCASSERRVVSSSSTGVQSFSWNCACWAMRSLREGPVHMHLDALTELALWLYAGDHINYARWITQKLVRNSRQITSLCKRPVGSSLPSRHTKPMNWTVLRWKETEVQWISPTPTTQDQKLPGW